MSGLRQWLMGSMVPERPLGLKGAEGDCRGLGEDWARTGRGLGEDWTRARRGLKGAVLARCARWRLGRALFAGGKP